MAGCVDEGTTACPHFNLMLYERPLMARPTQKRLSRRKSPAFARLSMGIRVRIAGLLVILGVLLSFGLRLSHMLLVQHVVCEHGHLVDERQTKTLQLDVRNDELRIQAGDHDGDKGDEHDHCDVMSILYRSDDVSITPSLTTLSWLERIGLQAAPPTFPIDIITLAPKASPPAV